MFTLHIEHAVTDFGTWQNAFSRLADVRTEKGVPSYAVRQPIDDPHFVLIDLEFAEAHSAEAFQDFLHTKIWSDSSSSPALVGAPKTRVLETKATG